MSQVLITVWVNETIVRPSMDCIFYVCNRPLLYAKSHTMNKLMRGLMPNQRTTHANKWKLNMVVWMSISLKPVISKLRQLCDASRNQIYLYTVCIVYLCLSMTMVNWASRDMYANGVFVPPLFALTLGCNVHFTQIPRIYN